MSNPLLSETLLPQFSQIKPEHIQPAISQLIQENRDT
ncbi:peptidase, partial [Avibacterium gallinarum]